MLSFEFDGELFQFEQREPEFAPLLPLPPNCAAFSPGAPLSVFDPGVDHAANLGDQRLGMFLLVDGQTPDRVQKPHPKPQLR